ncbi:DUF58 domain-containing protein [Halomarina litorea]|uniref:DUF58 domain-containing protein n=1 Tax=Halomarina litorea TaxID=2961595 RepID=UPI0020C36EAA|nr:DUF58 domain-containing protein [Halomarina sp. BCD28]
MAGLPFTRRTGHWTGVNAAALVVAGAGVLLGRSGLVLAGCVAVGLVAYASAGTPPAVSLRVERTLSTTRPDRDEDVEVRVAVTNEGESLLPDLRVVDGVPTGLAVEEGSPRHGTALRPGKTARFSYTLRAERGVHRFDPATVVARDSSGASERRVAVRCDDEVRCVPPLPDPAGVPLRAAATGITGETAVAEGGPGSAFYAVREYRRGDPLNRIDWNRAARTGRLSTVEFQRERSASVAVVVDARAEAYVAPAADDRTAVERCVEAAGAVFEGRRLAGDRVGLAALAPEECWLAPTTGEDHRLRARELLATHPALAPTAPEEPYFGTIRLSKLRRRLPAGAQVVFCSPLADDYAVRVARRLDAAGNRVTVVSPDPTTGGTPGRRLARVERSLRCSTLRESGIPVVDWRDGSLQSTVANAVRRWSR